MHLFARCMCVLCIYGRVCACVCSYCITCITVKRDSCFRRKHLCGCRKLSEVGLAFINTVVVNFKNLDEFQIIYSVFDDFMLLLN